MVPLIFEKVDIENIEADRYLSFLRDFLFEDQITIGFETKETDLKDILVNCLLCIKNNDEKGFSNAYGKASRRTPKQGSDWINNPLLFFSVSIGCKKFNQDFSWLIKCIYVSSSNSSVQHKRFLGTTKDFLQGNYSNLANYLPLQLVLMHFSGVQFSDINLLETSYKQIVSQKNEYFESPLWKLIDIRALQIILSKSEVPSLDRKRKLERFLGVFNRRAEYLAVFFSALISSVITVSLIVIYKFYWDPALADSKILTFLGVGVGGSLVSLVFYTLKIFGFLKGLIKNYFGAKMLND